MDTLFGAGGLEKGDFFVYVSTCNVFLHILNHTTTVYLQAALTYEHFVELSLITDQPKMVRKQVEDEGRY